MVKFSTTVGIRKDSRIGKYGIGVKKERKEMLAFFLERCKITII